MSTIQTLKNFIRHGKQARDNKSPADQAVSNVQANRAHHGISEPAFDNRKHQPNIHQDYSAAAVDNRNVAAQAGPAAAHAADANHRQADKQKQVDKDVLARIVAEEREAKGKLPQYPGLDRYQLIEKMGDGAFSNVYRARDLRGEHGEVAIKVVRKFEMNATQVSPILYATIPSCADISSRATQYCIQTSTRKPQRQWRSASSCSFHASSQTQSLTFSL